MVKDIFEAARTTNYAAGSSSAANYIGPGGGRDTF